MALKIGGLQRFQHGLDAAIDRGTKRAAEYVGELAQQLAPVDTGALRNSKSVEGGDATYKVRFSVPYAAFVEYGTISSPAQPFLGPALKNINVKEEIRAEIQALAKESKA